MLGGMRREQVWKAVSEMLRDGFGRLLEVRDVRRVRRVAGEQHTAMAELVDAAAGKLVHRHPFQFKLEKLSRPK